MEIKLSEEELELIIEKLEKNEDFINKVAEKLETTCAAKSPWMNKKKTCDYLNICNNTLTEYIEKKDFPVYQLQNRYFIDSNEVDIWVKNNKKK